MNIGILGGSFDPPHIGHYFMAIQAKELMRLDEVWLVPCFSHPLHKDISLPQHRLHMTQMMKTDGIKVSDFEIRKEGISYTIDTLEAFKKKFSEDSFTLIIGSDQLVTFPKWKKWQDIVTHYEVIVIPRETNISIIEENMKKYIFSSAKKHKMQLLDKNCIITNVSSTQIRSRVKEGKTIKELVNEKVENFIKKHQLYSKS
ncbi:MAG: nicotinate (nicotinamide) nucleotide adenylyltransferase [bacterium]|nr:nicotinate (nicotinamide) nucleotide adenylyltransferase [bacterium]